MPVISTWCIGQTILSAHCTAVETSHSLAQSLQRFAQSCGRHCPPGGQQLNNDLQPASGRAHSSLGAGRRRAQSGPGAHPSLGGGAAVRASQSWQQVPLRKWIKQDDKSDLCIYYPDLCLEHTPLLDICGKKSHVSKASTELRPSEVRRPAYRASPLPAGRGANPARPYGLISSLLPLTAGLPAKCQVEAPQGSGE
jgi:hypothetical protein